MKPHKEGEAHRGPQPVRFRQGSADRLADRCPPIGGQGPCATAGAKSRGPGGKPGRGRTDRSSARRAGRIPVGRRVVRAYCGPATGGADMPSAQIDRGQLGFYAVRPRGRPGGGPRRRPSRPRSTSSCTGSPPPRLADSKSLPGAVREAATTNPRSRVEHAEARGGARGEIRNAVARLGDRLRDVLRTATQSTSTSSSVASPNAVARDTARAGSAARRSLEDDRRHQPDRIAAARARPSGERGAGIRHQSSWSTAVCCTRGPAPTTTRRTFTIRPEACSPWCPVS